MYEVISQEKAHELVVQELERALEYLKRKDYRGALVMTAEVVASLASCFSLLDSK